MMRSLFTDLRATAAPENDRAKGLLYFIELTLPVGLRIQGITLRKGLDNKLRLSFPRRRDAYGIDHSIVRPTSDASRHELEQAVIAEIRRQRGVR